ncbi:MAG: ABC transporter permease [Chloroflexota bacterium]|nr:ABC transporter permease [Chloroflexota bacterium]
MTRPDALLPNAGIVARREYRDRTRSPLFVASTIILAALALGVALAPIAIRYLDRETVTRIAVVADDDRLATMAIGVADSLLNVPPAGGDPDRWEKTFALERVQDRTEAEERLATAEVDGIMTVERLASGQLDVRYRTNGRADGVRSQLVGFAAIAVSILDWTATLPPDSQLGAFQTPRFAVESINVPTAGGEPVDQQELASRAFLGIVFVVLIFITVVIYGMWVATGVAAEKSSRVMELMISAASPRQLLTGKVVGIGLAGITQYLAIVIPALAVLAVQDRIAEAILGPTWAAGAPIVGLTPSLLLAYGVFFLLGFTLFALIYASMGAFVSRPDDLQTLSLPLSLLAMGGYLAAIMALGGGGSQGLTRLLSFVPPFSPFVMLARVMTGSVQPWELVLSIALMVVAIVVVAAVAVRLYAAGVLLYGQRPGVRAFIAAARRAV